jgi:pre-mRNA-splicing factor CWC22
MSSPDGLEPYLMSTWLQNIMRGKGLFCRSVMKSAIASPAFAPVFAAMVAIINTKLPEIGALLAARLVRQVFRIPAM